MLLVSARPTRGIGGSRACASETGQKTRGKVGCLVRYSPFFAELRAVLGTRSDVHCEDPVLLLQNDHGIKGPYQHYLSMNFSRELNNIKKE